MATLVARNQSVASIRAVVRFIEDDEFVNRNFAQVKTRLQYLNAQWPIFVENNNLLRVEAADQNDEQAHIELFDEIEQLYLEIKAALVMRAAELEQANQRPQPVQQPNVQQNPQQIVVRLHQNRRDIENTWGDFDGTLTKWRGFCDLFADRVHNDDELSPAHKFRLLKNSLKGDAARALGDWEITDDNYLEAWNRLKELYEQTYVTGGKLMRKLWSLQKLDRANGTALQKLSNIGNEVFRQLRALQFPVVGIDYVFVYILHDKLDVETSTKWNLERASERPTLPEFLAFLDRHARAALSAHGVPDTPSVDNKKRQTNEQPKVNAKRWKPDASKPSEPLKCVSCSEAHPLHRCPEFLKLTLANRRQVVRTNNLCLNCLRAGHMCKECPSKECFRCKTKHNSLLCNENPLNKVNVVTTRRSGRQRKSAAKFGTPSTAQPEKQKDGASK